MDSHARTFVKSLTWRIVALVITVLSVWYYSKDWSLALTSGFVGNLFKGLFYYGHERYWNKVKWGVVKK